MELAARAAGREPHAAPFTPNITGSVSDPDRAFAEADAARKCGFRIGGGLHPAVVEPQIRGFAPTDDEISDAAWVLQEYRKLDRTGGDLGTGRRRFRGSGGITPPHGG